MLLCTVMLLYFCDVVFACFLALVWFDESVILFVAVVGLLTIDCCLLLMLPVACCLLLMLHVACCLLLMLPVACYLSLLVACCLLLL